MATRLTPEELKQISTFGRERYSFVLLRSFSFCSWPADSFICRLLSTTISSSKQKPIEKQRQLILRAAVLLWIRTESCWQQTSQSIPWKLLPGKWWDLPRQSNPWKNYSNHQVRQEAILSIKGRIASFESCAFKE